MSIDQYLSLKDCLYGLIAVIFGQASMACRSRRNRHGEHGATLRHVRFLQAVDNGGIDPLLGLRYQEASPCHQAR